MQDHKNHDDKERSEQQANLEATENMSKNSELQNEAYRTRQNEASQSTDGSGNDALTNNHEQGQRNDALSLDDKNKRRLENEKDADFGNEQLE